MADDKHDSAADVVGYDKNSNNNNNDGSNDSGANVAAVGSGVGGEAGTGNGAGVARGDAVVVSGAREGGGLTEEPEGCPAEEREETQAAVGGAVTGEQSDGASARDDASNAAVEKKSTDSSQAQESGKPATSVQLGAPPSCDGSVQPTSSTGSSDPRLPETVSTSAPKNAKLASAPVASNLIVIEDDETDEPPSSPRAQPVVIRKLSRSILNSKSVKSKAVHVSTKQSTPAQVQDLPGPAVVPSASSSLGIRKRAPIEQATPVNSPPVRGPELAHILRSTTPPAAIFESKRKYSKLHFDIINFVALMGPTPEEDAIRRFMIRTIEEMVLKLWPNGKIVVYGSYNTKLLLPTSDLDIVVITNLQHIPYPDYSPLRLLEQALTKYKKEWTVTVLENARVPLIKIHPVVGCDVDISFNSPSGIKNSKAIQGFMEEYPALYPLTLVVKYFLHQNLLNEPHLGGLGSYATTLLVVRFLQQRKLLTEYATSTAEAARAHPSSKTLQAKNIAQEAATSHGVLVTDPDFEDLGHMLVGFLKLYGYTFNYYSSGISVRNQGGFFPKASRINHTSNADCLCLEDPTDPTNDVGRPTSEMRLIRHVFAAAHTNFIAAGVLDFVPPGIQNKGNFPALAAMPICILPRLQEHREGLVISCRTKGIEVWDTPEWKWEWRKGFINLRDKSTGPNGDSGSNNSTAQTNDESSEQLYGSENDDNESAESNTALRETDQTNQPAVPEPTSSTTATKPGNPKRTVVKTLPSGHTVVTTMKPQPPTGTGIPDSQTTATPQNTTTPSVQTFPDLQPRDQKRQRTTVPTHPCSPAPHLNNLPTQQNLLANNQHPSPPPTPPTNRTAMQSPPHYPTNPKRQYPSKQPPRPQARPQTPTRVPPNTQIHLRVQTSPKAYKF
ncbi:terminal nucleotidyltransferase 4A [Pelomyxa schiedti]|nr:terminal nucleotidyltransferase 4A [Pelomyxa schiedti]